jgi:hypothetical protein
VSEALARGLLTVAGGYALVGVLFAVPFVWRGAGVVEPVAREGTLGFRFLILPGAITLWPYLLFRWLRARP